MYKSRLQILNRCVKSEILQAIFPRWSGNQRRIFRVEIEYAGEYKRTLQKVCINTLRKYIILKSDIVQIYTSDYKGIILAIYIHVYIYIYANFLRGIFEQIKSNGMANIRSGAWKNYFTIFSFRYIIRRAKCLMASSKKHTRFPAIKYRSPSLARDTRGDRDDHPIFFSALSKPSALSWRPFGD